MRPIWAVGLMTGTVLDGNIDVALIKTDGERIADFGTYTLAPYPQSIRTLLEETLRQARAWNFTGPEPAIFREAEEALTRAQSAAVAHPLWLSSSAALTLKSWMSTRKRLSRRSNRILTYRTQTALLC